MEVTIINFRCYYTKNPTIYRFPNGLCHLTGESGAGKSTVIMAIEWCLYGKNTGIKPRGKNTLVPEVTIKFMNDTSEDIIIHRKSPNYLMVNLHIGTPQEMSLESDDAQGWITTNFGSKDLWLATSCLFQGARNVILSGTGEEKFKILRELTYGSDIGEVNDPDYYLRNLKDRHKDLSKKCDQANSKYCAMFEYLDPLLDELESKNPWNPDTDSLIEIKDEIKTLLDKASNSRKKWAEYNAAIGINQKIKIEIENLPVDIDSTIDDLTVKINEAMTSIAEKKKMLQRKKIYERLAKVLIVDGVITEYEYSPDEMEDLMSKQIKRQQFLDAAEKYNLPSDITELQTIAAELASLAEYQTVLKEHQRRVREREQLVSSLEEMREQLSVPSSGSTNQMSDLSAEYITLESKISLKSMIVCPNCKTNIDRLTPEEESKAKQRLKVLSLSMKKLHEQLELQRNIQEIEAKLTAINIFDAPSPPSKRRYSSELQRQCNTVIDLYCDSLSATDAARLQVLKRGDQLRDLILDPDVKINEILSTDFSQVIDITKADRQLEPLHLKLDRYKALAVKRQTLTSQIRDAKEPNVPKPEEYDDDLKELNVLLNYGNEYERLSRENDLLIEKKLELDSLTSELDTLTKLIDVVKRVSLQPMEDIVTAINVTTNNILEELFDSPIQVCLSVYKPDEKITKTESKMTVNMQIFYGEDVYPNISNLSGGEGDRVSLALTLAMAKIHSSPMLIFDECMASLNGEYREKCLKVIRDFIDKKCVIDICHESVEGYHDVTIPVERE